MRIFVEDLTDRSIEFERVLEEPGRRALHFERHVYKRVGYLVVKHDVGSNRDGVAGHEPIFRVLQPLDVTHGLFVISTHWDRKSETTKVTK